MTFRVVVTENARANLRSYYLRAAEQAPVTAARWLDRFERALQTLASNPERCGLAPENDFVKPEIRQFLFGRGRGIFRVLLTIRDDEVQILHVRRAAMDTATSGELYG